MYLSALRAERSILGWRQILRQLGFVDAQLRPALAGLASLPTCLPVADPTELAVHIGYQISDF